MGSADRPVGRLRRWTASPALHFLALGACLFVVDRAVQARRVDDVVGNASRSAAATPMGAAATGKEIILDSVRVESIRRTYAAAMGVRPTQAELLPLLDSAIEEEVLFREALARGLEQGDRSIAWRMVQKMRYLGEDDGAGLGKLYERGLGLGLHLQDPVVRRILIEKMRLLIGHSAAPPTPDELAAYYARHGDEYKQPPTVTFHHVFFDRGRRGAAAEKAAADAAATAAASRDAQVHAGSGDPFVMGVSLAAQGDQELVKLFGADFARAVLALEPGVWSAPIQSAYGWHLVFVDSRGAEKVPDLAAVHTRVEQAYLTEKREELVAEFLRKVRPSYIVRTDENAVAEGEKDRG